MNAFLCRFPELHKITYTTIGYWWHKYFLFVVSVLLTYMRYSVHESPPPPCPAVYPECTVRCMTCCFHFEAPRIRSSLRAINSKTFDMSREQGWEMACHIIGPTSRIEPITTEHMANKWNVGHDIPIRKWDEWPLIVTTEMTGTLESRRRGKYRNACWISVAQSRARSSHLIKSKVAPPSQWTAVLTDDRLLHNSRSHAEHCVVDHVLFTSVRGTRSHVVDNE
jgi:hypothetical protein